MIETTLLIIAAFAAGHFGRSAYEKYIAPKLRKKTAYKKRVASRKRKAEIHNLFKGSGGEDSG